jgi:uncharacterized membrane protein
MEASTMVDRRVGERRTRGAGRTRASRRGHPATNGNVNSVERVVSAAIGSALLLRGVRNRSVGGVVTALVGSELLFRGVTGTCPVYKSLGVRTTRRAWDDAGAPPRSHQVERSITIGRPASELYQLFREPGTAALIFHDLGHVSPAGHGRMRWSIHGPLGRRLEWDSLLVDDRPGESIGWKSVPGSKLPNEGSVTFRPAPGGRGTETTLRFRFDPPGGALGDVVAKMIGIVPDTMAMKALRRFKSFAETGEVPNTEHNPSARAKAHAD